MRKYFALYIVLGVFAIAGIVGCSKDDHIVTGGTGTGNNNPPAAPTNPTPANGVTSQLVSLTLAWTASDPDEDVLTYIVLFGTKNIPSDTLAKDLLVPSFDKNGLAQGTTYYWQVIVKDRHNGVTPGPIWSFTTATLPTQGLVAYYPFNGNANDESGNGHNGAVAGATQIPDRTDKRTAYLFSGSSYISVPNSSDLTFGSRSFTLNAWVKLSGSQKAYAGIIASGPAGIHFPGYQLTILGGNHVAAQVGTNNGEYIEPIGTTPLDDGKWHFVSLAVDPVAGNARLYVDAMLDAQGSSSSFDVSLSYISPLFIGTERNSNVYFQGAIDDVRIYNRALSLNEIQTLFYE